jgi:hypothetical protein
VAAVPRPALDGGLRFGLIHGFGFASVLADLGLPQGALVLALLGFNVGVELGSWPSWRCSCRWPLRCAAPGSTAAGAGGRLAADRRDRCSSARAAPVSAARVSVMSSVGMACR